MKSLKKRFNLVFLVFLAFQGASHAQSSERIMLDIDNLYILPVTTFCDNRITLVAEVTTRSNGSHLVYEISREKNAIFIKDCFYVGMLTVINHFRVTIPLGNLEPGEYYVKYTACPSVSNEKCITDYNNCVTRELKFRVGSKFRLYLKNGWNIISTGCVPIAGDVKELLRPLIDAGLLVKVQDEKGNSIEDYGAFDPSGGWYSMIDSIKPSEGYKFKVNNDCFLDICGVPVEFPFAIPLKQGWNIIGYPSQAEAEAKAIIQELIERGTLVKVQDEGGNAIEDMGVLGGWQDYIGTFKPGKGYKVKVSKDDTLLIFGF